MNCLTSLCGLDIFRKQKLISIANQTVPLLLHPNAWVRYATIALIVSIAAKLPFVDVHCLLIPMLQPFFVRDVVELSQASFTASLMEPVRELLENNL